MRISNRTTRYRFFDAKSQRPLAEDDKKNTTPDKDPVKDDPQDDGDLKNVDQSKGGYGHGSGFDQKGK